MMHAVNHKVGDLDVAGNRFAVHRMLGIGENRADAIVNRLPGFVAVNQSGQFCRIAVQNVVLAVVEGEIHRGRTGFTAVADGVRSLIMVGFLGGGRTVHFQQTVAVDDKGADIGFCDLAGVVGFAVQSKRGHFERFVVQQIGVRRFTVVGERIVVVIRGRLGVFQLVARFQKQ